MALRFWNDPETNLPRIVEHGVTDEGVRQVLSRPGEELRGDDRSRIRLGQTEAGRYLQGVAVPDVFADSAFVVTAYDLTPKAKRAFRRRQWRKRKGARKKSRPTPPDGMRSEFESSPSITIIKPRPNRSRNT